MDVLVAIVIISILVGASVALASRYILSLHWDRLFNGLEQVVFDTNVYSLSGYSVAYLNSGGTDVGVLPEMHHLYFEKGNQDRGVNFWYFESQPKEGGSVGQRIITYKDEIDPEVDLFALKDIVFEADGSKVSPSDVLMTWETPLSQLSFRLNPTGVDDSDTVPDEFVLPAAAEDCNTMDTVSGKIIECTLTLTYERLGTVSHTIKFDTGKGVEREFY